MSEWEAWVGRTNRRTEVLQVAQANRMNVTLDREPTFVSGDPLPPAWHWLYFHDVVRSSDLGDEGHPRLGITMPPVPLPRRMWAGGRLTFARPLRLGEEVERVSTISSVTAKDGRSGPLFFVTVEHRLSSDGDVSIREEQTIVYRPLSEGQGRATTRQAPGRGNLQAPGRGNLQARWCLDSTALFRYSALTFNGHRIHYDADYCRAVEGYPNLVVHGPLLATLLLDLATQAGRPLHDFRYRALSPVFLPEEFSVNGRLVGEGTELWVTTDDGQVAMEATAT